MADSDGDHVGGTTTSSFSQLLFSDDDNDVVGLDIGHAFHYSSSSSSSTLKPPKMLCFGGYYKNQYQNQESDNNNSNKNNAVLISEPTKTTHKKSGVTCSDSSSATTTTTTTTNNVNANANANANNGFKSNSKRNGSGQEPAQCTATVAKTPLTSQRISKKAKMENPISTAHPKVRREKLGERITALQQLVSPFGKTDTASVLHEAMGYIRFLQDQVQVLCSPYLQHLPEGEENEEETRKDLKSRGLCLVPVEFTVHVASSNGADYWSPARGNNFSPSSSTKQ